MTLLNLFLEEASATADAAVQSAQGSTWISLIMIVAMVALFYFFLYRPQKKQEKAAAEMRNNLAVGDEVTTIGGIIGKIISIKDETCVIETTGDRTKIRFLKSAVKTVDVKAEEAQD